MMTHHIWAMVYQVLRHINIHLRLDYQPFMIAITYNGRVLVAKLKFLIIK